jgi:hypothetical protein
MGYKYQLGVDDSVIYNNTAGSTVITLTGSSTVSGNTLFPWIYAVRASMWHFANLNTTTSASITVAPAITFLSESLAIYYNGPETAVSAIPTGSVTSSAGAVVYGSGTDGLAYPIGCRLAEDGSGQYALKTDTELVLSGNIIVSNVRVFSTNGPTSSSSLVYGRAAPDGTLYVTSSDLSPVWVSISGSAGSGVSVTSSCASPLYSVLVDGGGTCYSASIDAYRDLHVYDTRVSGSILTSSLVISGSVAANTSAVYAVSSSVVSGFLENYNENRLSIVTSMFKYQLGLDAGSYDNAAGGTTVYVYGTTAITGSTICPWIYNATSLIWHYVNLSTVTTASFTVSPAITVATSSLIIKFNKAQSAYNPAVDAIQSLNVAPEWSHYNGPTTWISESAGAMGLTTSSDIPLVNYSRFELQFSRMVGTTCSLSATISTDASPSVVDFYDITPSLYGSPLINSDALLVQDKPIKFTLLRLNYYKSAATNGILLRYVLY